MTVIASMVMPRTVNVLLIVIATFVARYMTIIYQAIMSYAHYAKRTRID